MSRKRYTPEQIIGILREASVAVFPSRLEPFGLAAAEAIAAGVPSVISRHSGLAEIIEPNVDAFVADPFNEEDLAYSIMSILMNPEEAKEMAQRGQNKILDNLDSCKMALQLRYLCESHRTKGAKGEWHAH